MIYINLRSVYLFEHQKYQHKVSAFFRKFISGGKAPNKHGAFCKKTPSERNSNDVKGNTLFYYFPSRSASAMRSVHDS